jgi:DNA-binding transcriptional ArsR family regulator
VTQPTLFDAPPWRRCGHPFVRQPLARASDPATSHEAALRAAAEAEPQRLLIVGFLRACGTVGATAREMARANDMTIEQVDRRMAELREAGLVSTRNGKDGPGCLPLERREGCAVHVAREFAQQRAA